MGGGVEALVGDDLLEHPHSGFEPLGLRRILRCLFRSLAGLTWSAAQAPYAVPLREQVRHAVDQPPLAQDAKSQLLPAQAAALDRVLTALIQAEHSLTAPTVGQPYEPDPRPELRIRPPL